MKLKFILLACVMLIALTGYFNESLENHPRQTVGEGEYNDGKEIVIEAKKTLEDFKKALQEEGLELMPVEESNNDWILNNMKSNRFTVGSPVENTDPTKLEQVSIYVFESENARKKGLEDFNKQKERYDMMLPRIYEAKNVMVFYWARAAMDKPAKYEQQFQKAINQLEN
ncbi:hypothetical protein BVG16_30700 [Paenibacillus selenitireducens]|uniref:DUF4358 domain-containing protein n=1 Tax=Paenibacillus selenitireducens TaxID=1324314 RepID=A0A1T2WZJ0_9BACL|nr:hypothetical protein [Paenibacillus selenitireducens]OPA73040.1 hypothetical protein BVG16_30700 [Paenibacillus selenitireducens]